MLTTANENVKSFLKSDIFCCLGLSYCCSSDFSRLSKWLSALLFQVSTLKLLFYSPITSSLASVQRTNSLSFARLPLLECSREHTAHDWPDNYISGRSGHQAAGLFPSLTPLGFRLPQYIGEYVDFPTRWKDGHDRIRRWLLIGPDPVTVDTQFSS